MDKRFKGLVSGTMFLTIVAAAGCSTTNDSKPSAALAPSSAQSAPSRASGQKTPAISDRNLAGGQEKSSLDALRRGETATTPADSALKDVYFEFDSYDLTSEARATLKVAADWLKKNPAMRVDIEGHTDERGTNEYNLALGAKRAQAAKDYLTTLGIAAIRLSTNSYGEEIPLCREHNEECWAKNRRDRFVTLSAKPGV